MFIENDLRKCDCFRCYTLVTHILVIWIDTLEIKIHVFAYNTAGKRKSKGLDS